LLENINKNKGEIMKKKQEEYKPDDRICIFYIADRVHDLQQIKDHKKLQKAINEFKDELLHNIAIDVMIKRSTN
tara:strand:- start:431 stop:652 length:222 start_codon:yes stop_codon:yes gene_type:complete